MQQYIATGWRIKVINFIGIINLMILFLIFRGLYVLFDRLIDLLTGYSFIHGSRKERELAKNSFEHSAHFVNIVGRFTHDIATGGFLKSFLLWHDKYGDPRVVLKNDNITIQGKNLSFQSIILLISKKPIKIEVEEIVFLICFTSLRSNHVRL